MKTFALTCGDVNGIGPEIIIKSVNKIGPNKNRRIVIICPENIFRSTASKINPKFNFSVIKAIPAEWPHNEVQILDIGKCKQNIGNSK